MRAELVAVGSELLLGEITDTNSAWLSARLAEIGVDVHRHTTVGDNPERLRAVLAGAAERADVVIVGGGLGPTPDDLTRYVVADLAGVPLERDEQLVAYLRERFERLGRRMTDNNLIQCDVPAGCRVLWPAGTAAGFVVDVPADGAHARGDTQTQIWCVPGVPWELHDIAERELLPALRERAGQGTTISRLVRTGGIGEAQVADALDDVVKRLDAAVGPANPTVAFLASGGEVRVRVTAKGATREEAVALSDPVVDEIVERLGPAVSGIDDEGAEHLVARLLTASGRTLAVAESVTCGQLAARLVSVPGASAWLRGGLVCYATDTKVTLAGVDEQGLAEHGPVAEWTAEALARGAAERLGADIGVGVVGVAGPEPMGDQDVGTMIVSVWDGAAHTRQRVLPARTRGEVQRMGASMAVDLLRRVVAGDRS